MIYVVLLVYSRIVGVDSKWRYVPLVSAAVHSGVCAGWLYLLVLYIDLASKFSSHCNFAWPPRPPPVADAEAPELVGPWVDARSPHAQQIADVLLARLGALLVGCGGTGKTWLAREIIKILQAAGIEVRIVAFTHLAAQNIGGQTIHAFLHDCPSFKGVLVVDEASLVPVTLWGELAKYVHCGAQFFVLGDFRGQFMPAHNTWKGTELTAVDVEESAFLRRLCSCRRFELTINRRSDSELFDFYAPICRGGAREHEPLSSL